MAEATAVPPQRSANYAVYLLLVVYTLNYLDRQIMNIVAEPIKNELHLADTELGLLTGLAFAVFYSILGIPLAQFVDKSTTIRSSLSAICLATWSIMTALCGLATNFTQMLLARIGVGVGEAGCSPAAHSLISDLVTRERRASAMGIYSLGVPLGKLFGLFIGGVMAQAFGWRMSFIILGLPGVLLALLVWHTLPEPRRALVAAAAAAPPRKQGSIFDSIRALGHVPSFWLLCFGASFMSFLSYGQTAFLGSFMIRVHHLDVGQTGIVLGLALGGGGALGTWLGGRVADHLGKRDRRAYVLMPVVANLVGGALFVTSVLMHDVWLGVAILAVATALTSAWYGPVFGTVQNLANPAQRGMAAAIILFFVNLIGLGLGPLTFGALSDLANHGFTLGSWTVQGLGSAEGLRRALTIGAGTTIVSSIFFLLASRTLRRDLEAQSKVPDLSAAKA